MRILHIASTSTVSGANRYAFDLAAGQRDLGHEAIVAMPARPGDAFEFAREDIEQVKLGDPRALSFLVQLARIRPDVIHCHDGTAARWIRFAPLRPPALMTLHQVYKPATMSHFEGLHALAEWQMADLAGFKGQVAKIGNWIPALKPASESDIAAARTAAGAAPEDFLVVFVGRLVEVKGVHHLINAVRAIDHPALRLAIVGGGSDEAALKAQAENDPRIRFLGHSDLPAAWYGAADLVAMPSRREPFALVALEAMSCRAPILASDVDGFSEMFRDRPDCLTPVQDPVTLAARIAERVGRKTTAGPLRDQYDLAGFDRAAGVAAVTRFTQGLVRRPEEAA